MAAPGPARLGRAALAALLVLASAPAARAQLAPLAQDDGAVGLGLALRRLPVSANVLYVTAHPDDENNGVLVMLSRGRGLRTALLTVTRGDGGQNEIGPELFQALGILRTEELAAVHRHDAAEQYFTRAYEFGYSFSVEETFQKWGREEILRDVVRVVRHVRPDVILTLPLEAEGGGQHHQAAARLAVDAFRAAADPARFPEHAQEGLRPWQARKVYQGGTGGGSDPGGAGAEVVVSTGAFDPLLGMSWHELGSLARTSHKCQGTRQIVARPPAPESPEGRAAPPPRGQDGRAVYRLVDSQPRVAGPEKDIFDGVDTSLSALARFAPEDARVAEALRAIEAEARRALEAYDARATHSALPPLRAGLRAVQALREGLGTLPGAARDELGHRLARKEAEFWDAIALAHGLTLEATVEDGDVIRGQSFPVTARLWNQGAEPVRLDELALTVPAGWTARLRAGGPATLLPGGRAEARFEVAVGPGARYSQPYWKRDPETDRYVIEVPADHTLPWSPPDVAAVARATSGDAAFRVERPAWLRYEGRWVGGEKQKVVNVVPALAVSLTPEIAIVPIAAKDRRREFRVEVLNNTPGPAEAVVRLEAPADWTAEPREAPLRFRYEGERVTARFFVTAPADLRAGEFRIAASATSGGETFREGYQVIAYDHIQERHLFHPAAARVKAVDVALGPGIAIGYVMGAGDEVPPAIAQLGAPLTLLTADDLAYGDLSRYSTIVTGIRAYQTRADLRAQNHRLLEFAEKGGHLVVQYNKFEFNRLATQAGEFSGGGADQDAVSPFAPYPAAVTGNRITVEDAPVRVLVPDHRLLNEPNRIRPADFQGWVQERGLYFLGAKDPRYTELLSAADPWPKNPGEKKGMLVEAKVGTGTWTYVGLGLWRQLPAGTTGAYRLLANLLSRPRAQ